MPSSLRYFCCACGGKDTRADYSIYPNAPKRKRNKSKSSTFTRRRLLDNDPPEDRSNGANFQQMVFHAQSKELSRETSFDIHDSAAKLLNGKARNKRRKVQELFPSESFKNEMSRTTFPWMDENFVPNGSSNIRLGVSSVHLHARRKLSNGSDASQSAAAVSYNPDATNNINGYEINENALESSGPNADFKYKFKSHSSESYDSVTRENSFDKTSASRSVSLDEKKPKSKKLLSAPKSDVGVRKITRSSSGYKGDRKVPKLDELKSLPPTDVSHLARPQRRPHASVQNVFNEINLKETSPKSITDTSFSSGISFKSNQSLVSESSQKSSKPLTVVPRPVSKVYSKSNGTQPYQIPNTHNSGTRESMYGYIPKIVQSVQASNALEGSKIDDFFMNCLKDTELNSFASAQEIQTPRSQNKQQSSDPERSKSLSSQENYVHSVVKETKSEADTGIRNEFEIQQFTVDFGSLDSLDTDSVFVEPSSSTKTCFSKKGEIARYSTLDEEQNNIPFMDQEPDLIQGLQNVKVDDNTNGVVNDKTAVPTLIQPDKGLLWENSFISQSEYKESVPHKVPCHKTPPISRKGESLSLVSRQSHKSQSTKNHWLDNLDSEVLY